MTREEAIKMSRKHREQNQCPVDGEPIMTVQYGDNWLILWDTEYDRHYGYQRQSKMLKVFIKGVKDGQ